MSHEDITGGRGVRVGNETLTTVGEHESVRCIRDQIVVEPLDWRPSKIIITAGYQGKPLRGLVRAVGPGRYLIQYAAGNPPVWYPTHHPPAKGKRTASRESKIFRPCDLRLGDLVEFGGLELGGYLFTTFLWGTKEVVLCREEDVCGISENESKVA